MDKRPPSRFGAALIRECKKRNITQYRLAQLMGRSTRYLNNIEHDRSEPRFTSILLFAKALDMDPGDLVRAAAELSWAALDDESVGKQHQGETADGVEKKVSGKKMKNDGAR